MTDLNLPKGWTATKWQVRYDDARITVERRWVDGGPGLSARKLVVDWDVDMPSNNHWRKFDGVTSGSFDSEGDLATDLAVSVVKAKKALASAAKEWARVAERIP